MNGPLPTFAGTPDPAEARCEASEIAKTASAPTPTEKGSIRARVNGHELTHAGRLAAGR